MNDWAQALMIPAIAVGGVLLYFECLGRFCPGAGPIPKQLYLTYWLSMPFVLAFLLAKSVWTLTVLMPAQALSNLVNRSTTKQTMTLLTQSKIYEPEPFLLGELVEVPKHPSLHLPVPDEAWKLLPPHLLKDCICIIKEQTIKMSQLRAGDCFETLSGDLLKVVCNYYEPEEKRWLWAIKTKGSTYVTTFDQYMKYEVVRVERVQ